MSDSTVILKSDGLNAFSQSLKGKQFVAKIGIFNNSRDDGGSNAVIGAAHEFGTSRVPQRSFLRIPLTENTQRYLDNSDLFKEDQFKEIIRSKSTASWAEALAKIGKQIVADAFASGGFGKWVPLSQSTLEKKKTSQILVETGQLRDSIGSEVVESA